MRKCVCFGGRGRLHHSFKIASMESWLKSVSVALLALLVLQGVQAQDMSDGGFDDGGDDWGWEWDWWQITLVTL
jgi:hypothetical protein